jgi:hypothetical protein
MGFSDPGGSQILVLNPICQAKFIFFYQEKGVDSMAGKHFYLHLPSFLCGDLIFV